MSLHAPNRFDRDTRVTRHADGHFEADIDTGWWVIRGPNGGYIAAIALRAACEAVQDEARTPRSLTVHYLSPPVEGPASVETRIERTGRSLSTVMARMSQGDHLRAIAIAALSTPRESHSFYHAEMPDVPPADSLEPSPPSIPIHDRYEYRFANDDNRSLFDGGPTRWTVQMGGACARMGPLSGFGSPDRWAVFEGRIYLFASDECRETFLQSPDRFIVGDDAVPEPSAASTQRGLEILEIAMRGFGGSVRVDGLAGWHASASEQKDGEHALSRRLMLAYPDRFRSESKWKGGYQVVVSTPTGGFVDRSGEVSNIHASEWAHHRRGFFRRPLVILRARHREDFQAVAAGPAVVGDVAVERVACSFAGTTTMMHVDPENGRVLRVSFRGRDGSGAIGYVDWTYEDFRKIDGVQLPHARRSTFDGVLASEPVRWDEVGLNPALPEELFERPAAEGG